MIDRRVFKGRWRRLCVLAVFLIVACRGAGAQTYTISTLAGGALPVNIQGTSASLYGPQSAIAVDRSGNVFFGDGDTVLRLDAVTGEITLVAGNGTAGYSGDNGPAVSAQLRGPYGVAVDSAGNVYIASFFDNVVREVSGGVITTIAGTGAPGYSGDNGPAASAQLSSPWGLAIDSADNLYVADYGNNCVRRIAAGTIITVVGNGIAGFGGDQGLAIDAQLSTPYNVALDAAGNLYIADSGNNRIREVSGGVISTVAGNGTAGFGGDNGPATGAQLNSPTGVAVDSAGNLYIADYYNNRLREVSNGSISTLAGKSSAGFSGDGGPASGSQLSNPFVVVEDSGGNLFIADYGNNRIRKISGGTISTVAGNGASGFSGDGGPAIDAQLHAPSGIALNSSGDLYAADCENNRIRKISRGSITTFAGDGTAGFGGDNGPAANAQLFQPMAVAFDSAGNLYIADSGNNRVRKISSGVITTVAGNGTAGFSGDNGSATGAQLNSPSGVAVDSAGNLYIADYGNNRIRKVSGGVIATVAGNGTAGFSGDNSPATGAALFQPSGVTIDSEGNLYIADSANNRVRMVSGGVITTVAGNGGAGFSGDGGAAAAAQLHAPFGVLTGPGGAIYIADSSNNCIRRVFGGTIGTVAGGGDALGDNGLAVEAALANPQGIAADSAGNLYIADTQNNRIRMLTTVPLSITGPSTLPAGTVGVVYSGVSFSATGGTGTYTWSATGLPKGLTMSAAGTLSGTPTLAGTSTPRFAVKDSANNTASATLSIGIEAPAPVISSLNPSSAAAYSATFKLTVSGTGFLSGATVEWNASSLSTTVVSATQLTATVPGSQIGGAGNVSVVVSSGGMLSNVFSFSLTPPPPAIANVAPAFAVATGPAFTLTVNGSGFTQSAMVLWNGSALPTTYAGATQLTAYISATQIGSAGSGRIAVNSGGVTSSGLTFPINAAPAIASLSPTSVVASGAAFTLTVNGTGFGQGAQVQWNGAPLITTFVSATRLTAAVPGSLIANTGSVTILVNFEGASSNGLVFPINGPPAITALSPAAAAAGGAAFTLTVNGTGFASGATIQWNGTTLSTKFVSATQLTASISASLIASAGVANITVSLSGSFSAPFSYPINPPPVIAGLNPASVAGTGAPFTLTVNGTGFLSGAALQWNKTPLTTTYISATQLSAAIPANLAAGTVAASIVAVNPGGSTSAAAKLTITAARPVIATGGVVPIYSPIPVIQPGSWVSIYGTGLASGTFTWSGNFPTSLGGASVKIDNKPAYLWSVSPTQINLQAPADTATGTVNVVVTTAAGSMTSTVTLSPYGPSLSLFSGSGYAAGVILTPDGSGAYGGGSYDLAGPANQFSFNTRPVRSGEILELFGVGFGPTSPVVPPGKAYTGAAPTTSPVTVTIGGIAAQLLFSGITEAGVYQLNVIVPSAASGDQPVQASIAGFQTPGGATITLQ